MNTYRNTKWTRRDYECTNVVACVGPSAPASHWEKCDDNVLAGLTMLYRQGDVTYYGYM